ncbi:MAG: N-6 DNA methylase, partial [Actinomycetota bacterium]|nr:N-6 DNA methylase [Actinomycetota bacterium]
MAPRSPFTTITTEGGLLSVDLLARLARQPTTVSGTTPDDYHLGPGRRLRDAINRSWTELQGAWSTFAAELERLPVGERATTITRERWLLPLFAELGFGRLQRTSALNVNGRDYPVSHIWGPVPIHLLGTDVELDRRTRGVAGAASAAPFSMVQELLNRSEAHLWAVLSNGRRLRLLRDNSSLTRAAYVEVDLEAMFSGQVFTDFAVLWMACHESRFEADQPAHCWLERWIDEARQQGVRALDRLRSGFERAITALGGGFLAHPANAALRDRLRQGELTAEDYHRQVLRLVYRLVFLLVAEDRDLFHPPETSDEARRRYARYYSLGRIRDHARRHRGGRHADLFASLRPVFDALGGDGVSAIGVPALGSFLWSRGACPDLDTAALSNSDLLDAVRHLAYTEHDRTLQRVDFANLGPEELGSVYESLLELHPRLELDAARFELVSVAGSERKSTGSYYTPTALISALLDRALDPLLDEAEAAPDPIAAILAIKVLDPACGSGHFLTAAARRIATRLAAAQTGELNPTPEATRHALRQVVGRCIYGIDLNPMAIELAKVNLWLDAVEPGLPLRFLDHHLVCGNGLVGATPRLIAEGIPDEAFKAIEGDDKPTAAARKKTNAAERRQRNQGLLALGDSALAAIEELTQAAQGLDAEDDSTPETLRTKQQHWEDLQSSPDTGLAKLVADTWCAAFFAPKTPDQPAITDQTLRAISADRADNPDAISLVVRLAERYRFLHPHLAFPDVFAADPEAEEGWQGGFDLVLGNPPWDTLSPDRKEFFSAYEPDR